MFNITITWLFLSFFVLFSLFSCKRQDPNPELKDPIYKDLSSLAKKYEKKLKEALNTQEKNFKDLSEASGMELKVARKKIADNNKKIIQYKQMTTYYQIRSERRKVEGRRAYRIAFKKGEDWPNPNEYQSYLVNKRLREASRSSNRQAPKIIEDRYKSSLPQ